MIAFPLSLHWEVTGDPMAMIADHIEAIPNNARARPCKSVRVQDEPDDEQDYNQTTKEGVLRNLTRTAIVRL